MQASNLGGLCPSRRCASPVLPFGLSLGDAFALPLEHQLSLKLGNCADNVEHQTAGAIRGVDGLVKHLEGDGLRFQPLTNGNEMRDAAGQPIEPCDDKSVAFPCILKRGLKLLPLGCR
jgi:hypothetical protein